MYTSIDARELSAFGWTNLG